MKKISCKPLFILLSYLFFYEWDKLIVGAAEIQEGTFARAQISSRLLHQGRGESLHQTKRNSQLVQERSSIILGGRQIMYIMRNFND